MSGGPGGPGAPRCVIVEQPASKALRFRYECEGRSAGSIPGVNSTADNKTYPTIQIEGYKGRAVVVVSCVTKDPPYRPHPHSLVGKEGCKKGVCTMEVNTETMTLSFANLGIQCIKKKDIDAALAQRKDLRIDPFKTGFGHRNQPGTIDLNAVRLCFQSFLEGEKNQFNRPIMPVVSEPIYDKKAMSDLVICKLSEVSASVIGGKEIILLCEKVAKEDISVRLYEELNGQVLWEGQCDFQPTEVHKQVAISFRTPKYKDIQVTQPVKVMIQLLRPSDKATSEPRPFLLTPIESGRPSLWSSLSRRRPKADYRTFASILHTDARLMTNSRAAAGQQQQKLVTLDEEMMMNGIDSWVKVDEDDGKADPERWNKINDAYAALKKTKHGGLVAVEGGEGNVGGSEVEDVGEDGNIVGIAGSVVESVGNVDLAEQQQQQPIRIDDEEVGFTDLLNQVNELDSFCDNNNDFGVYSSLQLAMKNPCDFAMETTEAYEDIAPPRPTASKPPLPLHQQPLKSDVDVVDDADDDDMKGDDDCSLPPLPPKRVKKSSPAPPPLKNLPPTPVEGTKKLNLFQKLFSSSKRSKSRKGSLTSSRKGSVTSLVSRRTVVGVGVEEELAPRHEKPDEVALTEAEHYALYTSLAPHATASEFDEMSFYYSPVEGRGNTDVPVK